MIDKIAYQSPPNFFKTGPAPAARLGVFVALSFLLLVLDARFQYMGFVRESLGTLMLSIQRAAAYSTQWIDVIEEGIAERTQLNAEIEKLRKQQYKNTTVFTQLEYLANENNRLRKLLALQTRLVEDTIAAEVLFEVKSPFERKVAINKGSQHGISTGQAVVTADGLFGQITQTYPFMSEVTLVSDKHSTIPVQILRNAFKTIAHGTGGGDALELKYVELAADVQEGDVIITSGIDGTYLPGIPVGKITSINRAPVSAFAKILCKPAVSLQEHMHVLVLTKNNQYPQNPFLKHPDLVPDPLPPLPKSTVPGTLNTLAPMMASPEQINPMNTGSSKVSSATVSAPKTAEPVLSDQGAVDDTEKPSMTTSSAQDHGVTIPKAPPQSILPDTQPVMPSDSQSQTPSDDVADVIDEIYAKSIQEGTD